MNELFNSSALLTSVLALQFPTQQVRYREKLLLNGGGLLKRDFLTNGRERGKLYTRTEFSYKAERCLNKEKNSFDT